MTALGSDIEMADRPEGAALSPEIAALLPAVSRVLGVWDTLALEMGDVAVVTDGHPHAELMALAATWYGALPVLRLSRLALAASPGVELVAFDDPQVLIKAISTRLGARPGVAVVDLSGRTEVVDVLLSSIPPFTRLLLAGAAREPLTIDFYNNVHRKGIDFHSGLYDPSLERGDDQAAARRLARATRLLRRPERVAACHAALASPSHAAALGSP